MDVELKTYLLTPSAVTDEDHVCQTCREVPGGQNRDIHLTFSGPDCNALQALRHDYQASLRFAALGNNCVQGVKIQILIVSSGIKLVSFPDPTLSRGETVW